MNRRSLLSLLAAPLAGHAMAADVRARRIRQVAARPRPVTMSYGPSAGNVADLYLPDSPAPPVVCLLHGGFWRAPHGREQMVPLAEILCRQGFAAWNVGYRRIGEPGVAWPQIAADVIAAIDFLHSFESRRLLDLGRVAVVGHSAGGQLALACTSARAGVRTRIRPALVVALAAVTDLEAAFAANLGNGAVDALLGGAPRDRADAYLAASPSRLLPHGARQVLIHAEDDAAVPIAQSRGYARRAAAAGDDVVLEALRDGGHMQFLEVDSRACDRLREALTRGLAKGTPRARGS